MKLEKSYMIYESMATFQNLWLWVIIFIVCSLPMRRFKLPDVTESCFWRILNILPIIFSNKGKYYSFIYFQSFCQNNLIQPVPVSRQRPYEINDMNKVFQTSCVKVNGSTRLLPDVYGILGFYPRCFKFLYTHSCVNTHTHTSTN